MTLELESVRCSHCRQKVHVVKGMKCPEDACDGRLKQMCQDRARDQDEAAPPVFYCIECRTVWMETGR